MKINAALKNKLKKSLIEQIKHPGEREVVVHSPYPLKKDELSELKKKAPFLKDAHLVNVIDESLLGGIVIVDGSRIIDVSVKGKMNEIISSLLQSY